MIRRFGLVAVACAAMMQLVAACGGDEPAPLFVAFVGRLIDDDSNSVPDANVFITARDGTLLSATITNADGRFAAGGLEKNIEVALLFSGDDTGLVRTVFSGETETRDSFLFTGAVFQRLLEGQQTVVDDFTTASGATGALMTFSYATNGSGAMVRGRVVRLEARPDGLYYVNVPGATVSVRDGAGAYHRVYYRGDFPNETDPGPIEPARTVTGDDSRFVAFRVPTTGSASAMGFPVGLVTVVVSNGGASYSEQTLVVEDGLTVMDQFTVP